MSVDSLKALIPAKEYLAKQKRSKYYHIRYGDTLSEIARRFGTSVDMLLAINNISNEHYIRRGMTIRIPVDKKEALALAKNDKKILKPEIPTKAEPIEKIITSAPKEKIEDSINKDNISSIVSAPAFTNGKSKDDLDIEFIQSKNPPIGYIRVEAEETLGHFAEWLQIKTQRIRDWNSLSFRRAIDLNQKIKLIFNQVTPDEFNRIRLEYHHGIEEDFFMHYNITGTKTHKVRTGENLWYLCNYIFNLPIWLVVSYNKDIDFSKLKAGDTIVFPDVKAKTESGM